MICSFNPKMDFCAENTASLPKTKQNKTHCLQQSARIVTNIILYCSFFSLSFLSVFSSYVYIVVIIFNVTINVHLLSERGLCVPEAWSW